MNLGEALRRHASMRGTHRALIVEATDAADDPTTLDFAALELRVRALAAELQARGARGEPVLVVCPPGLDFIVALGACFFAGAIAVPCRPPQMRLADRGLVQFGALLADAQPRLALTPAENLERARWFGHKSGLALHWLPAEAPQGKGDDWRNPDCSDDDVALLQYTSGSTGAPRGVAITHTNLASNIAFIAGRYAIDAESVVVNWLPPHHDMGLIGHTLLPLMLGCTAMHMPPMAFLKQPRRWLSAVTRYRGTHGGGPNFGYELCVRAIAPEERGGLDLSSWHAAHNGAEPVRAATLARFADAFSASGFRAEAFAPCYGLAESTLMVSGAGGCSGRVLTLHADRAALADGRLVSAETGADAVTLVGCGEPAPGAGVAIVADEHGSRCAEGQVGEIWISGPSTASGYWRTVAHASFGARLPGSEASWHRTGDLGAQMHGQLFVTGRLKDLIIIAGRNVYPQDVETSASNSHPALLPDRAAAFGCQGEWSEEVVLLCEVRRAQRGQLDAEAVFAAIRSALLRDCEVAPAAILLVREHALPVTGSGKIRRAECRSRYAANDWEVLARSDGLTPAGSPPPGAALAAPAKGDVAAMQRYLIASLADMLRRAPQWVQPHQTLTDLGLDSLGRVELTLKLQAELGVHLPADELAAGPSVEALAQRLAELSAAQDEPARAGPAESPSGHEVPLVPLQREFLWEGVTDPGRFATVLILRTPAGATEPLLTDALTLLEREFDALTLRFDRHAGRWRQRQVAGGGAVRCTREDASGDPAQRKALRAGLTERLVGGLDIGAGPLLNAVWMDRGIAQTGALAVAAHHLVSDGLSMVALIAAFERNYRALAAGAAPRPVLPERGFTDWARQLERLSTSPAILEQEAYWRQVCGPGTVATAASAQTTTTPTRHLDEAATARFLQRHPGAQQQHDALLAAFALAAAQVLGLDDILVRLENHGRHNVLGLTPNLSAGWMVCEHPLRVRGLAGADWENAAAATALALRAVPDAGLGYGVLRHLRGRLDDCAQPRLGFTFRGRLDDVYRGQALFRVLEIGAVAAALWVNPAEPDLRLVAHMRGASLVWTAGFRPEVHAEAQAAQLVERMGAILERASR